MLNLNSIRAYCSCMHNNSCWLDYQAGFFYFFKQLRILRGDRVLRSCTGIITPRVSIPSRANAVDGVCTRGWNNIWLQAEFLDWSIEDKIVAIRCPLLAVQGIDDEYGTLAQVHGIERRVAQTEVVELADCGHSPHRGQAQELIRVVIDFVHDNVTAEVTGRTEK